MTKNTRTVRVTSAQKSAAKALVSRSAKTGRYVSPSVTKIANAKTTTRSAATGRYVTTAQSGRGTDAAAATGK
ncbi:MAG: hypothetical protein L0H26_10370 [Microlunatus sp.]|nr:hypothetical protein [Microlunatus sp.]MDN5804968.1 hypothetical protein [Microlunatus sp.]